MTNPDAEQTGTSAQMLEEARSAIKDLIEWMDHFEFNDEHLIFSNYEQGRVTRLRLKHLRAIAASQYARETLEPYCQHLQICSSRDPLFNNPCDCGLEAALAAPQPAPALSPSQQAERLPNSDAAEAGADAVALADGLEARWDANETESNPLANGKMIRIGYGELDKITAALRAQPSPGVLTGFDASQDAQEALTERSAFIKSYPHLDLTEISDAWGRPMFMHTHVQALWDGWFARAALAAPQPQAGASEPVAWRVRSYLDQYEITTRKERADEWTRTGLDVEPLYATPSPTAAESLANPSK